MRLRATSINVFGQSAEVAELSSIIYGITNSGSAFNLRSLGTVNYTIDWGDGSAEQISTSNNLSHTFTAGDYTLKLNTDVAYRPFFNDVSADIDQIVTTKIANDTNLGSNLENAWSGANNMITFSCGVQATLNVSNFDNTWLNCSSLISFPSIATTNATTFINAWKNNTSLIVFPPSVFDSTGTLASNAFEGTFNNCALNSQSLGYILLSLDANGASNIILDINGGTNADINTISDASIDAYKNLRSKSWNISHNGSYNDIVYTINSTGGVFNLRSTGTVDYDATWGDGSTDIGSTTNTLPHTYAAGTYSLGVYSFIPYRPYFNNSGDENQITSAVINSGANLGTDLSLAWKGANNMTSFVCPTSRTSNVTNFNSAWHGCSGLTSFPLIDASNSTNLGSAWQDCSGLTSFPLINSSSCTDISNTWNNCSSLTSFPALSTEQCLDFDSAWKSCSGLTGFPTINTSNGTNLTSTWEACSNLTSFPNITTSSATTLLKTWSGCSSLSTFPILDTSNTTTVKQAWLGCSSLTTFPSLNVSSCTDFESSWQNCTSLSTYPADVFNSTGSLVSTAFLNAWNNCALTPQSIENILKSLDVNGISNIDLTISGGTNANASTWSSISRIAYFNLQLKNWNISINGTVAAADITYTITNAGSVFNLRSAGGVDYVIGWGDGSHVESSTSDLVAHTYSSGNYSINIETNAAYRPYFNDVSADVDQITTVLIRSGAILGTSLQNAWSGANNMTSFVCDSTKTAGVTNFTYSWCNCSSLTSFPVIDTSNGLDFSYSWENCSGLTAFPTLTTTSGTNFEYAWCSCSSLTAFPTLAYTNATNFSYAWNSCTNLTTFPAGVFNTTGTLVPNAFSYCWTGCALSVQSIENILVSLNTNGQSNISLDLYGGTNADASVWSDIAINAYNDLVAKGWNISYNGVFRTYELTYTINTSGTFVIADSGTVNYDVNWGDGSAIETVTTNNKSHTYASSGTYTVKLDITGSYKPYLWANNLQELTSVSMSSSIVLATDLYRAFGYALNIISFTIPFSATANVTSFNTAFNAIPGSQYTHSLTSFPLIDTSSATNVGMMFYGQEGLTTLPLFDLSNVTRAGQFCRSCKGLTSLPAFNLSSCTTLANAFLDCTSLTSFPAITLTTACTNFNSTWAYCTGLTSFPVINTSGGTNFNSAWRGVNHATTALSQLVTFPSLDFSSATTFNNCWAYSNALANFPANMFDSTGTLATNAFTNAFKGCALTAQSIENILVSLVQNTATGVTLDLIGGTNADASTWSTAAIAAYTTLSNRGWNITQNGAIPATEITYSIINNATAFELRDSGAVNYIVDWGDSSSLETVTSNNKSHTYSTPGFYTIKLETTGSYRPFFNNNSFASQISSVTIDPTADLGTNLQGLFNGCIILSSLTLPSGATGNVTNMQAAFSGCVALTSLPLINTSSVTNFRDFVRGCTGITQIASIDTSSGTDFMDAFRGLTNLNTFPAITLSSGTTFEGAWNQATTLTAFPSITFGSSATNFVGAWNGCTNLATFPASLFDACVNLSSNSFSLAFTGCALTVQSIENILVSLVANGSNGVTLDLTGGTNADISTWSSAAITAYNNLVAKGWNITQNGTNTIYEIVYSVTVPAGTYTLRGGNNVAYTVDWGDGTTTSETTQDAAHTYASSGTYSIKLDVTGTSYYPKFWGHTSDAQKINSFVVDAGANLGTSLFAAWENASNLTTFTIPDAVMTSVTDLRNTWAGCSSLTSFPLLSIGNALTVNRTWYNCTSLASMPSLDYSSCIDFYRAWRNDTSLTTFPANAFDSTGTLGVYAFNESFENCALTAQSIENILTSLDTNGQNGVTLTMINGTSAAYSTWSTAAQTALTNLNNKGWNITYNT